MWGGVLGLPLYRQNATLPLVDLSSTLAIITVYSHTALNQILYDSDDSTMDQGQSAQIFGSYYVCGYMSRCENPQEKWVNLLWEMRMTRGASHTDKVMAAAVRVAKDRRRQIYEKSFDQFFANVISAGDSNVSNDSDNGCTFHRLAQKHGFPGVVPVWCR